MLLKKTYLYRTSHPGQTHPKLEAKGPKIGLNLNIRYSTPHPIAIQRNI